VLDPVDRDASTMLEPTGDAAGRDPLVVRGTAADIVGWGIGRSQRGVLMPDGEAPPRAPTWL
jgi:hypothetical protein